jgi:hypothetical protein
MWNTLENAPLFHGQSSLLHHIYIMNHVQDDHGRTRRCAAPASQQQPSPVASSAAALLLSVPLWQRPHNVRMEGVPGLTAPPVGAPELTKWDSAGVAAWLLEMKEPWATEMAETLQLAGTTGALLVTLTLEDLLEAEELGISEDHANRLLLAVKAAVATPEPAPETGTCTEPEPEPEQDGGKTKTEEREEKLRAELSGLKLGALNKRAMEEGVDGDAIEAAMDSDDPKAALTDALMVHLLPG